MGTLAPGSGLLGREAEFQVLGETLNLVSSGRPAIVLVEGEAGIGKTQLLEDALQNASGRGMQVVAGRAEELERTRPFGVLTAAFGCTASSADPQRAAIAELLAIHRGVQAPITVTSDPGLQFRAVDAFADLVEEIVLAGALVIGVDDLQWADPSSLLTMATLSRRIAFLPAAIIGCLRPAPRSAELERLCGTLEAVGARRLALGPLSAGAVRELVADKVAAEPGPRLLAEVSGAAGNPLFITELLGALIQEGAIETDGGRAEIAEVTLPPTLRLTILRRLSFLPEVTLQALQAASVLGSSFSLTDLAVTTGRPALGLSLALAEAIRARVLEDDGTHLRFRHDLIRDSIYDDLPETVRRGLHREAGQRLAASGAPAQQVAEQLARGARPGDADTVGWLIRAACEAAPSSPSVAAGLLARATGLMDPADPDRDRLLAEQAGSLLWAGRITDSERACRALLGRAHDPAAETPARICLGQALLAGGRPHDALRELERAGGSASPTESERATAMGWASLAHLWMGNLRDAADTGGQARSAAAAAEDHLATSIAMFSLAEHAVLCGHFRDAIQLIDEAVKLADQSPGKVGHRYPLHVERGFILLELDRLEEARSALDSGRRISKELGTSGHLHHHHAVRACERFISGEWDDAIAEIEASVGLADETGQAHYLILGRSVLSLISLHRNEMSRAKQAAAAAVTELDETGARHRAHWALWARALILEAEGKVTEAFATLAQCWDLCAQVGLTLEYRMLGADLVRVALACGDNRRAREAAAAVAELASENGVASLDGAALRCQGLAEDNAQILKAAVGTYADGPRLLELALACEDAGTAFARQGMADQARPLLDQALQRYEHLEAARDIARAEAVLREVGIRRGRRGRRGRPKAGWKSLTPTEQTVVGLVADGLTNPQIGDRLYISHRTVQTHLAHVFAKLDINSRSQLAAEVTRRRVSTSPP